MATSTNIQYLVGTGKDEFGVTVQLPTASHRRQIETYISGGVILAGDWLAFDTTQTGASKVLTVVQAGAVATGNALVAGVALEAATAAGQSVDVVVAGFVTVANVAAAIPVGTPVIVTVVAGRAQPSGVADLANACGVTLTAVVANVAEVLVYKSF